MSLGRIVGAPEEPKPGDLMNRGIVFSISIWLGTSKLLEANACLPMLPSQSMLRWYGGKLLFSEDGKSQAVVAVDLLAGFFGATSIVSSLVDP
ncbi:hypothetical protein Ancab_010135 [Ancistrocladus abbreviatus]